VIAAWFAILAVVLGAAFARAVVAGPNGELGTGVDHNIGDLPFHFAIVTSFTDGANFPPEHPELASTRLTYPVVADFVTALFVKAGAGLAAAMTLQSAVLGLALLGLLYQWARSLAGGRAAALLAPTLVLLSGGLGFLWLLDEVDPSTGGLAAHLGRLTHDYTIVGSGELRWGNVVLTMLIPQRSFLFGLPLFLIVCRLWWRAVGEEANAETSSELLTWAGLVAGLLPLAHMHTFTVALGIGACLALLFPDRRGWLRYFTAAIALGGPQVLWLATGSQLKSAEFLDWEIGWDRGGRNPLSFWLMNLGLYLPAGAIALLWRGRDPVVPARLARFTAPFLVLFVVPNLLRLSPWIWDNIKFLVFWHLAWAVPVALLLVRLWRRGGGLRVLSAAAAVSMVLSGALDLWRAGSGQIEHVLFPAEGVAFAQRIRETTPPRAVILHAPTYNSEVYLTGRRSVLGYPGHIWSQGLDAGDREREVKAAYQGLAIETTLNRYGVGYVLIGPREREWAPVDEDRLRAACPPVAEQGAYVLLGCAR
jgi:hypothetical protein